MSETRVKTAARLSLDAYNKVTYGRTDHKMDLQCYTEIQDNTAWLAVRGTEIKELKDVWTDLRGSPAWSARKLGLFHRGFFRAAKYIEAKVRDMWMEHTAIEEFILTGHSMGAAIALHTSFLAPDIVTGVVTFGCPPCCRPWGSTVRPSVIRVENVRDPICRAQFYRLYQPYGFLTWLDRDGGNHQLKPAEIGPITRLSQIPAGLRAIDLEDHSMATYFAKV